ncbi:RCC1 domain-containing protein [Paenibacillus elgii]|uniref:RCC1 domain-containing protein n=1 Tax=Paenibacillus elgii TaxID=189691 RepID=UPI0020426A9A|nr:RCC1 domain-containing protein [Paenibacillus elgii]MCM3267610.1 RCC1 repeat- and reductase domain-containing protein [Paenibacillus elgii]
MKTKGFMTLAVLLFLSTFAVSFSTAKAAASSVKPKVSAGNLSGYALKSDGTVWAWGNNGSGRLGDGTTTNSTVPIQVSGLDSVVQIAAGGSHCLALKSDGTVWAWGANTTGALGNGTKKASKSPEQVLYLNSVIAIAANDNSSMALKSDGTVWAWGSNAYKKLGIGTTSDSQVSPVKVHNLNNIVSISMGFTHSLALQNDETVWAWGAKGNNDYTLGDGTKNGQAEPIIVSNLDQVAFINAGTNSSMVIKQDGSLWQWGAGYANGIRGNVPTQFPKQMSYVDAVKYVATYHDRATFIKPDGSIYSIGAVTEGFLGTGQTSGDNQYIPYPVVLSDLATPLKDMTSLAMEDLFTLAIKKDGTVWAWGHNTSGQLGDGTKTNKNYAVQISGLNLLE